MSLNEPQQAAVDHPEGPLLIFAGAGSGKCVDPSTLVWSNGLRTMGEVFESRAVRIASGWGTARVLDWYDDGENEGAIVDLECGTRVNGTWAHRVWARRSAGQEGWCSIADLRAGDAVALGRGCADWGSVNLEPDEAYALGLLVADGCLKKSQGNKGIQIDKQRVVLERIVPVLERWILAAGGRPTNIVKIRDVSPNHAYVVAHAPGFVEYFRRKYGHEFEYSEHRSIPKAVLHGTRETMASFLRGYFDGDGYCDLGVHCSSASRALAEQTHMALLGLGIFALLRTKQVKGGLPAHIIDVRDTDAFAREVGFSPYGLTKDRSLERLLRKRRNTNKDVIPHAVPLFRALASTVSGPYWRHIGGRDYSLGRRSPGFGKARQLRDLLPDSPARTELSRIVTEHRAWSIVRKITPHRTRRIDCTVENHHAFVGNGIVNHNTRVLTHRIAKLVERGVDPASILAVTFTNKAAGEMEERLIPLIGRDATDVLWLGTFHATGVRILRALAAFTTRKSDFSIYDEHDQLTVVKQALEELHLDKKQFSASELRDRIVEAKEKAFTYSDIPAEDKWTEGFVRVWERYEAWLDAANAYDFEDLLLVPMRLAEGPGAAGEKLRTRFQHVLVDEFQDTSHTQWRFVKALGQATGNITVVGDDDQCHPVDTVVKMADGDDQRIDKIRVGDRVATWSRGIYGVQGAQRVTAISARAYDGPLYTFDLPSVQKTVSVTPNHRMLVWRGGAARSIEEEAEKVQIDDLMRVHGSNDLVALGSITVSRHRGPVYSLDVESDHTYVANGVVVHNCIYEWRSADVKIIRSFPEQFPACKVVKLEENYRSSGHVVKAALDVIRTSKSRTDKSLWTRAPAGHPVEIHALDTDRDEGRLIARSIQDERAEREGAILLGQVVPVPTVAILYRTHAIARAIEEPLRNAEIPYVILGGPRFYDRKEIRDVLAYLRLVQNPSSNVDLLRAISVPARGLGAAKLTRLQEISSRDGKNLWLATADLLGSGELRPREAEGLRAFRELIYTAQSAKKTGRPPSAIAEMLLEESGYHEMWLAEASEKRQLGQHDKAEDAEVRAANVLELVSAIGSYEADQKDKGQRATLDGYLERVALMTSADKKTEGAVVMMTIHAAKGLEFDRVFIVGCEDGLLPLRPEQGEMSLDEERRLMYVAITRAKKKLSITWSKTRFFRGKLIATVPSRFLRAIDPEEYGDP